MIFPLLREFLIQEGHILTCKSHFANKKSETHPGLGNASTASCTEESPCFQVPTPPGDAPGANESIELQQAF